MTDAANSEGRFYRWAQVYLVFLLGVILFGAVVRITGSGAGCGQHWPTCHGEVLHLPQSVETTIELSHRLSSGLTLPLAFILTFMAFRRFPKRHLARTGAVLTVIFLLGEAAIGARLVLLGLVGLNDSWPRAYWMALHLTSTCLLTFASGLMVWASRPGRVLGSVRAGLSRVPWQLFVALALVYLVAASGAITALGDTLYPAVDGSVQEVISADQSSSAHFLQKTRVIHPVLAVVTGLFVLQVAISIPGRIEGERPRRLGNALAGLTFAQLVAGGLNIWLAAPAWMQVLHLGMACAVWLALVSLTLEVAAIRGAAHQSSR